MTKTLIIGKDSYLAQGLEKYFDDTEVLSYHECFQNPSKLQQADTIINFCISPLFSQKEMKKEEIFDVQVAKIIQKSATRYFFLSSRKVYGISKNCLRHKETDPLFSQDMYAKNKITSENALQDILKERCIILRLSNIIGEPIARKGYKTFMGWISENYIVNGKLPITQNLNAKKDFITKKYLHKSIACLAQHASLSGIYNISAGFSVSVKNILENYVGKENLIFHEKTTTQPEDQFILDNTKLKMLTQNILTKKDLQDTLKTYRQHLDTLHHNYQTGVIHI